MMHAAGRWGVVTRAAHPQAPHARPLLPPRRPRRGPSLLPPPHAADRRRAYEVEPPRPPVDIFTAVPVADVGRKRWVALLAASVALEFALTGESPPPPCMQNPMLMLRLAAQHAQECTLGRLCSCTA